MISDYERENYVVPSLKQLAACHLTIEYVRWCATHLDHPNDNLDEFMDMVNTVKCIGTVIRSRMVNGEIPEATVDDVCRIFALGWVNFDANFMASGVPSLSG